MVFIPATNLEVFPMCLGTGQSGLTMDRPAAFRMFDAYAAAGGNFIDTAKVYTDWLPGERSASEKAIGEWLRERRNRSKMIIATKGGHPELESMHIPRLSPAKIIGDLESSLRNLGVDTIDLYWLHRDDPVRPVSDILATLSQQAQAGKIRYYGCSNWTTRRIREAQDYATTHDLPGFVASQMMWSLAVVDPGGIKDDTLAPMDAEMLAYHYQSGLPAIPFSSQAGGLFAKLADGRNALPAKGPYRSTSNLARLERVQRLSRQTGLSVTQIVLGYLLSQPFFTLPVIGPRTLEQLADSLTAAEVHLAPDQVKFLEA
jgi:aryl-alcohol dehydrogenase-like predicted oxidoreductase